MWASKETQNHCRGDAQAIARIMKAMGCGRTKAYKTLKQLRANEEAVRLLGVAAVVDRHTQQADIPRSLAAQWHDEAAAVNPHYTTPPGITWKEIKAWEALYRAYGAGEVRTYIAVIAHNWSTVKRLVKQMYGHGLEGDTQDFGYFHKNPVHLVQVVDRVKAKLEEEALRREEEAWRLEREQLRQEGARKLISEYDRLYKLAYPAFRVFCTEAIMELRAFCASHGYTEYELKTYSSRLKDGY